MRISVDLEPLLRLYDFEGAQLHKLILKNALALESAGADGIVFATGQTYDPARRRVISTLAENLDINLSLRTVIDQQWLDAMPEIKPSMVIFPFEGTYEDRYRDAVTRLQVENILVAFNIKPQLELVKAAAKLKGDFVVFDCRDYLKARNLGSQIEELNQISKAAALATRLSMGSIADGDFDSRKLAELNGAKAAEEVFIGIPILSGALQHGYADVLSRLKS